MNVIIKFHIFRAPDYANQVGGTFTTEQATFTTSTEPERPKTTQTSSTTTPQPAKTKPKVENNNKSFTCTECGKGLARKDKLVSVKVVWVA